MLDDNTREAGSAQVNYEWGMLSFAAIYLALFPGPSRAHNGSLEVFLIHYRRLLEFIEPRSGGATDVKASDFLDGYVSTSRLTEEFLEPIDRQLAQISYTRTNEFGFAIPHMIGRLVSAWMNFVDDLGPSRRHWFHQSEFEITKIQVLLNTATGTETFNE